MVSSQVNPRKEPSDRLWHLACGLVLFAVVFYGSHPRFTGFDTKLDGEVVSVGDWLATEPDGLHLGDRITRVGEIDFEDWATYPHVGFSLEPGSMMSIELIRNGQDRVISRRIPRKPWGFLTYIHLPLTFWLAAVLAVIFLRPRGEARTLLVLTCLSTAVWIASGVHSFDVFGASRPVFHVAIWLFTALMLHLHLVHPEPVATPTQRRVLIVALYTATLALACLEFAGRISVRSYLPALSAGVVFSLVVLGSRWLRSGSPEVRMGYRLMTLGMGVGLAPAVFVQLLLTMIESRAELASWTGIWFAIAMGVLLPVWPLTYLYAIHRHDIGTVRYRANRIVGTYTFVALFVVVFLLLFGLIWAWLTEPLQLVTASLLLSLAAASTGPLLHRWFTRTLDRFLLGVTIDPDRLLAAASKAVLMARKPRDIELALATEVLPILLVRQSGLYLFAEDEVEVLYQLGPSDQLSVSEVERQIDYSGGYQTLEDRSLDWVRLAIAVRTKNESLGVWLLGRRDPDNYYTKDEIQVLQAIADSIASSLENLRLVERTREEAQRNALLVAELEARNAEMERFTYTVSHDLKSPLITIQGFLGALSQDLTLDPSGPAQEHMTRISAAARNMGRLLDELLELSRIGRVASEPTHVSVTEIARHAAERVAAYAEGGVELAIPKDLPSIYCDQARLTEVLQNLLENAARFMGDQPLPRVRVGVRDQGDEVVYFVEDNGQGIEPQYQDRVFRLFERLHPDSPGTGVGLAIVKRIIEVHDGRIWMESEGLGKGTTVCFTLSSERPSKDPSVEEPTLAPYRPIREPS